MMPVRKYPRIPHLPWSPGVAIEDKRLVSAAHFIGMEITISEKLDGSNLCLTRKDVFARSHSGPPRHVSFDMAKSIHSCLGPSIPEHLAIYGEWLYAVHSLVYNRLPAYFLVFNILDIPRKTWISHSEMEGVADALGLPMVPVLAKLVPDSEESLRVLTETLSREPSRLGPEREGVVVKLASECPDADFGMSAAKWVRPDHPKDPINHWMTKPVERQRLA